MKRVYSEFPDCRIFFGEHPFDMLVAELADYPAGPIALFTGRHSADANGSVAWLQQSLLPTGRPLVRFKEIETEPTVETVVSMEAFLQRLHPAAVVALGGGSVMDAAKAAYLIFQSGKKLADCFGVNRYSGRELDRIIAIPTTAGTGSEATPYSNIVDRETGVKKLISERMIVPKLALVSPSLTMSMSASVTRATGCDALAHSIEGFLNVGADGNSHYANDWALESIRLIHENLKSAITGEAEARNAMARAALLGGMVIRFKSTGLPHLCSFSWFGRLEHGIAVAMLLPACWRYYLGNPAVEARTMALCEIFPGTNAGEVIESYRRFLTELGVPTALSSCPGITPELLQETARSAGENRMKLELAPRPVPVSEAAPILTELLNCTYRGE